MTTRKNLLALLLFLTVCVCNGQNLVPNPSFEVSDTCPSSISQVRKAKFWRSAQCRSTPDYYNSCTSNWAVSVPVNFRGNQAAHTGTAYVGIFTSNFPTPTQTNDARQYREYLETELTKPLEAGKTYSIRFYVSAADSTAFSSNNLGVYFSPTLVYDPCIPNVYNPLPLPYTPQFENPNTNHLTDRFGWTPIQGKYVAAGGEKFMVIGNFRDATSTTITETGWVGYNTPRRPGGDSYYYIDDVELKRIYLTGFDAPIEEPIVTFSPVPFHSELTIKPNRNGDFEIVLYDLFDRKMLQKTFTDATTVNTEQLPAGIYFYELRNGNILTSKGKVLKQ